MPKKEPFVPEGTAPSDHTFGVVQEIVATAMDEREPLFLGIVPVKWKESGKLSWMIARANRDKDEDGMGFMEPMALIMDDELMARLEFEAPVSRVGEDERSQMEAKSLAGFPQPTDDVEIVAVKSEPTPADSPSAAWPFPVGTKH